MITKVPCPLCGNPIEFEAEQAGARVNCPHCASEITLTLPAKKMVPAAVKPPASEQIKYNPVKVHLENIRRGSMYGTLRGLIDICVTLLSVVIILFVLLVWSANSKTPDVVGFMLAVGITAAGVALIVISIALRQASLVVVDIADTLLYEHSKK